MRFSGAINMLSLTMLLRHAIRASLAIFSRRRPPAKRKTLPTVKPPKKADFDFDLLGDDSELPAGEQQSLHLQQDNDG